MSDFQRLIELLAVNGLEDDPAHVAEVEELYRACKPAWQQLLERKPKSAASRQMVEKDRRVEIEGVGRIDLDLDPDVRLALLLSDDFDIDEVECVRLLLAAHDSGDLSPERAAGVYFQERYDRLASLARVLQYECFGHNFAAHAGSPDGPSDLLAAISRENDALLKESKDGHLRVLQRLLSVVAASNAPPTQPYRVASVTDAEGSAASRDALPRREATLAAECVFYLCYMRPSLVRGFDADVTQALTVLAGLSRAAASATPGDSAAWARRHQANLLLVAVLCLLSPPVDGGQGGTAEAAERADVARFARAVAGPATSALTAAEGGVQAVVRLALAAVALVAGDDTGGAREGLLAARQGGALGHLRSKLFDSIGFQDDLLENQELIASVIHALLRSIFEQPAGDDLLKKMVADLPVPGTAGSGRTGGPGTGMEVDAGGATGTVDSLPCLLDLLRSLFSIHVDRSPTDHLDAYLPIVRAAEIRSGDHPAVLIAYLGALAGLATSPAGSKWVQEWLVTSNSDITWDRLMGVVQAYCDRFAREGPAVGDTLGIGLSRPDVVMVQEDADGLAAFADALAAVAENGTVETLEPLREVLGRTSRVDRPWDTALFALMCYRVPSVLKAALMRALNALAAHPPARPLANPDSLWQMVNDADLIKPDLRAGSAPYDIRYQLEEIESRLERYAETLAFVKLVNTLVARCGAGPEATRYTAFVLEMVCGRLSQRAFVDPTQKWELAEASFVHMGLCLQHALSTQDGWSGTPGGLVMADLLGRGPAAGTLLQIVGVGVKRLSDMREGSTEGAALERALVAGLDVLSVAFESDGPFLVPGAAGAGWAATGKGAFLQSLDRVLLQEMRRLPRLLESIGYAYEPAVQAAALRVVGHLVTRVPHLVGLLVQAGHDLPRIVKGFARCLDDSLTSLGAQSDSRDPRAALALRVLSAAATQPAPNLAHLAMGYDMAMGVDVGLADPLTERTVLHVILKHSARLALADPPLAQGAVHLVATVAAAPLTRHVTLQALRQEPYRLLLPLLEQVVRADADAEVAGLPSPSRLHPVPSLRIRTSLLTVALQELFYSRVQAGTATARQADSDGEEGAGAVLACLFAPRGEGDGDMVAEDSLALQILKHAVGGVDARAAPAPPLIGGEMGQIVDALRDRRSVAHGGVWAFPSHAPPHVDMRALSERLVMAARAQPTHLVLGVSPLATPSPAGHAGPESAEWAAVVDFARSLEAAEAEAWSRGKLLEVWRRVVEVAVVCLFDQLLSATRSKDPHAPLLHLFRGAMSVLPNMVATLGASGGAEAAVEAAACVAWVVVILVSKMAELRTLPPATSDFPAPMDDATKREVLSSILAVRAPPDPTVRGPLCLATLQALHLATRAPAWPGRAARGPASAPPAAADVAAHAETIAEAARDAAASPDPHLRATGLLMAAAAVGCDATGLIADELYRTDVPRALLRGMAEEPLSALQEAGRSGDSTGLLAIEGALALLQALASGGGAVAATGDIRTPARRLFELAALRHLANCRAFDVRPEPLPAPGAMTADGATGAIAGRGATLRAWLHRICTPVLQLALSVVSALPESSDVASDGRRFLSEHAATLVRMIEDAGDGRTGGSCDVGAEEVEQASLVMELAVALGPLDASGPLHAAALALAEQILRGGGNSPNRFASAVRTTLAAPNPAPSATGAARRMARHLHHLRSCLARYLALLCRSNTLRLPVVAAAVSPGQTRMDLVTLSAALADLASDFTDALARRDGLAEVAAGEADGAAARAVLLEAAGGATAGADGAGVYPLDWVESAPRGALRAAAGAAAATTLREEERALGWMVWAAEGLLECVLLQVRRVVQAGVDSAEGLLGPTSAQASEAQSLSLLRRSLPDVLKALTPVQGTGPDKGWSLGGRRVPVECGTLADLLRQTRELLRHAV